MNYDRDRKQTRFITAMKKAGHEPKMDDNELDYFAFESGHCNGPACAKCGHSCCWHCAPEYDWPECTEKQEGGVNG